MSHHHHTDYEKVVSEKGPQQLSSSMKGIFVAMIVVGLLAFVGALFLLPERRIAWISFLHNLYYFTGLSAGGMCVAAIMHVARSHWGRPVKRFAESMAAFLPVTLVGIIVLWIGAMFVEPAYVETTDAAGAVHKEWIWDTDEYAKIKGTLADPNETIWEWVGIRPDSEHFHNKHFWLQTNFVFGRQALLVLLLIFVSWKFRSNSDRTDFALASTHNSDWPAPSDYGDHETEVEKSQNNQTFWGVAYCFAYPVVYSLMAYDFIMSLDYRWVSSMFGGWNFTSGLLQSWGMLVFIAWWMGGRHGISQYFPTKLYHDLGKLTFGFTIVWGYLFFAQLNVIWYGNLGHETGWLITRFHPEGHWGMLGITVACMVFLLPFLIGLGKKRKYSPATFAPVVIISAVGLWLERFLLITPAAWYYDRANETFSDGVGLLLLVDFFVLIGFIGIFCLLFARYLYKRPVMVVSDPKLDMGINRH